MFQNKQIAADQVEKARKIAADQLIKLPPMATGEEPVLDQINLTIEGTPPNIAAQAPTGDQKAVFKAGLFITLVSIGGILNHPITATATRVDKTHTHLLLLSEMFHVMVWLSLAIGLLLILLSTIILHRIPTLLTIVKPLTQIGWALATITLGYGSSLVLMVSSSPWFALYVIFLFIRFM